MNRSLLLFASILSCSTTVVGQTPPIHVGNGYLGGSLWFGHTPPDAEVAPGQSAAIEARFTSLFGMPAMTQPFEFMVTFEDPAMCPFPAGCAAERVAGTIAPDGLSSLLAYSDPIQEPRLATFVENAAGITAGGPARFTLRNLIPGGAVDFELVDAVGTLTVVADVGYESSTDVTLPAGNYALTVKTSSTAVVLTGPESLSAPSAYSQVVNAVGDATHGHATIRYRDDRTIGRVFVGAEVGTDCGFGTATFRVNSFPTVTELDFRMAGLLPGALVAIGVGAAASPPVDLSSIGAPACEFATPFYVQPLGVSGAFNFTEFVLELPGALTAASAANTQWQFLYTTTSNPLGVATSQRLVLQ